MMLPPKKEGDDGRGRQHPSQVKRQPVSKTGREGERGRAV